MRHVSRTHRRSPGWPYGHGIRFPSNNAAYTLFVVGLHSLQSLLDGCGFTGLRVWVLPPSSRARTIGAENKIGRSLVITSGIAPLPPWRHHQIPPDEVRRPYLFFWFFPSRLCLCRFGGVFFLGAFF